MAPRQQSNVVQLPRRSPEPFVTLKDLTDHFGYSRRWFSSRIAEGMPRHRWGGGAYRFRLSEVQAWLEEREERHAG